MTDVYLLPIGTAALLFPALAFVMFVPTAIVLYRRHGVMTRWRLLSLYGGVYYALTAFCMVIVPLPKPSVDVCTNYPTFAKPQLTPGVAFSDIWKEAHHHVTLDALILHNSAFWQTVFNLILLLPLGVFVRIHFRRGLVAATVAGFAGSLFFELTQYTGLWGLYACPYRLFAVDDLIVNTAGAALGWAAAGPLARALPALDALDDRALAPLADGKVPFGRRLMALLLDVTGVALLTPFIAVAGYSVLGAETALLAPPIAFALWFVLLPWLTGTTPGKHILRLRLVTPDGGRPSPARLALRALILSPVLLLTCLGGGTALSLAASAVFFGATASTDPSILNEVASQAQEVAYRLAADPVTGLVLLLPPALCLALIGFFGRVIRRHPQGLGPHETRSGIRNHALPPTRARIRPDAPAQADPQTPATVAAADGSRQGG
ncbi:VanZ family protein [Streptomyces chattanoogensis]|uniref:VanZ family protein n=1 Tax=Streptomyces chattanoogensis TaxID=66876 RepID=UPI0006B604E4|nr:VanZ family protein [Streptomyces chattanoogensis]